MLEFLELVKGFTGKTSGANCVLVEPTYHSPYPPLGLLKLSTLLKSRGHTTELVKHEKLPQNPPDLILVTSLFTYEWLSVAKSIDFYRSVYKGVPVILGGIYASVMQRHASENLSVDYVWEGVVPEAEQMCPDYSLVPGWNASIGFSSRGCIRRCPFCIVWKMEPTYVACKSISHFVSPNYSKIILWDNNFLASPYKYEILSYLVNYRNSDNKRVEVDFNQGLDARLLTQSIASQLAMLKTKTIRLAYDKLDEKVAIRTAIENLVHAGINKKKILVYTLFNYTDTPGDFLQRLNDLMEWGVAAYPMRYQPNNTLVKNEYISPFWTSERLNMVEKARRVLGVHGAFPPYEALRSKLKYAADFDEAMSLKDRTYNRGGKR